MKTLITIFLILSSTFAGSVTAGGICATELCEKAEKIPNLPPDVRAFVDDRDGCDHFRGEPWSEGNDPEVKGRREFIFQNLKELCTGTDKRLKELRKKYRHEKLISELLDGYEVKIERNSK